MGKGIIYTDEFKRDAVVQVKQRSYSIKKIKSVSGFKLPHCGGF